MEHLKFLAWLLLFLAGNCNGQVDLGKMETWDNFNDVDSDMITMMRPNQLMIRKFEYNGDGPAAWFMVGKEEDDYNQEFANMDGTIIPDEEGSCDRLGRYDGEDIMLTLPGDMKFTDYDYISVYCIRFSHNFGYIRLRRDAVFNSTQPVVLDQVAGASGSTEKPLAECDQEPEPRGENCDRQCQNDIVSKKKRRKGGKLL